MMCTTGETNTSKLRLRVHPTNARSSAAKQPERFLGVEVNYFYLASWYDKTQEEWRPPQAWNILLKTPWGSTDWTNPRAPLCKAMKDIWSKHAGNAALNNALRHNSNTTKTAFDNLPVEFRLALNHDFHWERYEGKQKSGYYDSELGEAMLLYLIEKYCHMAETFWGIKLAKT